ncbi:MAG: WG repeat-containing protein [Pasteurella sp.]|nr:WG repeat-containing protein [Pasteurella sp.]
MKRSLLFLSLLSAFPSYAEQFPNNECAVIVASRQTVDEVKDYINENVQDKSKVKVYKSSNGWNAITVAMLKPDEVEPVITEWKASGKIPQDSFCSRGQNLNEEVVLNDKPTTSQPVAKVTKKDFYYIANNKLTKADLKDYSKGQLRLLRNYFFAKKGFTFKEGSDLDTFFKTFSWYSPKEVTSTDIYDNQLSEQEKNNVSLILAVEKGEDLDQVSDNKEKSNIQNTETKTPKSTVTVNEESKFSENNTIQEVAKVKVDLKPIYKKFMNWNDPLNDSLAGFIDSKGEIIVPLIYDRVEPFDDYGFAIVKKAEWYSVIDSKGKRIVPLEYDYIKSFSNGLALVKKHNKYGFINTKGQVVLPLEYDFADSFREGLALVIKDKKYSFINTKGKVVIPLEYDYVDSFSNGKGKVVIPLEYDYVDSFSNGLAKVGKDDKYGFIDTKGKVVIPLEYDYVDSFSNGLAKVRKDKKYGFIDTKGKVVIPLEYDFVDSFSNGLARATKDDKYGVINTRGDVIISFKYSDDKAFYQLKIFAGNPSMVRADKNGNWGIIDNQANVILPFKYNENIFPFSNGLFLVEDLNYKKDKMRAIGKGEFVLVNNKGKHAYINNEGKVVTPLEYDYVGLPSNGLLKVRKDWKYGFINNKGEVAVPLQYDYIEPFTTYAGALLSAVEIGDKKGYINTKGDFFDSVFKPTNGLYEVKKDNKSGLINNQGEIILPLEYDFIYPFKNSMAKIKKDGKYGMINDKGAIILLPKYSMILPLPNGKINVMKDGELFSVNEKGECIEFCN